MSDKHTTNQKEKMLRHLPTQNTTNGQPQFSFKASASFKKKSLSCFFFAAELAGHPNWPIGTAYQHIPLVHTIVIQPLGCQSPNSWVGLAVET